MLLFRKKERVASFFLAAEHFSTERKINIIKRNLLIYPTAAMNITQRYDSGYSHAPCSTGSPPDFPIDDACSSEGRSWFYCPCDEMKIKRIYGVGNGGTNTLFLESTSKVIFADGTEDYCSILVMHSDDSDLSRLKKNQIFRRGERICREGTDGFATGNHFHISAGKGKFRSSAWVENSKGQWVINTKNSAFKPEELFFVDKAFTKIISTAGISFRPLAENESSDKAKTYTKGNYCVTKASLLNVRTGPGTSYKKKSYGELTGNARKQIYKLTKNEADGYVKGVKFTVSETDGSWGKTPSGWVCIDYCTRI